MGMMQQANDIIEDLASLFGEVENMDELDAADFKDNAAEIWKLRQDARQLLDEV
jgi:hypothetical protein